MQLQNIDLQSKLEELTKSISEEKKNAGSTKLVSREKLLVQDKSAAPATTAVSRPTPEQVQILAKMGTANAVRGIRGGGGRAAQNSRQDRHLRKKVNE